MVIACFLLLFVARLVFWRLYLLDHLVDGFRVYSRFVVLLEQIGQELDPIGDLLGMFVRHVQTSLGTTPPTYGQATNEAEGNVYGTTTDELGHAVHL
jgi:hypothetical protein